MIIIGVPNNINDYYLADEEEAYILEKKGFHAKYVDSDYVKYFKLNNKLVKELAKHGIQIKQEAEA